MSTITAMAFPAVAATSGNATSSQDNTTITANDFMTLLVAQMKNQDPTAPTDPSQYMQQLVSVNSLQQLMQINQQLTSLSGSTNSVHQARSLS